MRQRMTKLIITMAFGAFAMAGGGERGAQKRGLVTVMA